MPTVIWGGGPVVWSGERDSEGHRSYKLVYRVKGAVTDGPAAAMTTPGLPLPGQIWAIGNDLDIWAWCRYDRTATPEVEGEANEFWRVECNFSTKPPEGRARAHDPASNREDPLLEPPKISGGFTRKSVEITHDRFGKAIKNSAHEQVRGNEVEFDESHPTVVIEFNTLFLNLPLYARMRDTVNDRALWGMPKRTIRLADISWERRYHANSFVYYSIKLTFEANARGWDRTLLDEGTKALSGDWVGAQWVLKNIQPGNITPDATNPAHFIRFKDRQGENSRVVLDGAGKPYVPQEVNTCGQCTDGHPQDYVMSGTHLGEVRLEHQGVCEYSMQTGGTASFVGTVVLDYSFAAGNWLLTITPNPATPTISVIYGFNPPPGSLIFTWSCFGENRMTKQQGIFGQEWPDEVFVTSGNKALPGKIYVEHYRESNFLLLGIPAVLG